MSRKRGRTAQSKLMSLGEEKINLIETMMVKGKSNPQIADVIQKDWKDFKATTRQALSKMLLRYRKANIDAHLHTKTKKTVTVTTDAGTETETVVTEERVFERFDAKIDILKSVEEMVNLQTTRLQKLYTQEAKMPVLMASTRNEVTLLSSLLKQLSELQFDMGLMRRQPKKLRGTIDIHASDISEQDRVVRQIMDSKEDRLEATGRVFALMEDMVKDELQLTDLEIDIEQPAN